MNTSNINYARAGRILAVAAAVSFAITGCATAPQNPQGSAEVRSKLIALQANSNLADKAPVEIREAETAVVTAEQPVGKDVALGKHRVFMADRKIEIAMAVASTRYAESQRAVLSQERDQARLDARTREADTANRQAAAAQSKTEAARALAVVVAADAASDASAAASETDELQRQIDVLQAEATDRGLVVTLGSVLFATGRAELKEGGTVSLDKLVTFLGEYPDRGVVIEGHTDDVGSDDMNQSLSQRRADSVRSYLMQKGIQSGRLTASGMGESQPVADNESVGGREQNRRVEIIIENPASAIPAASTN
jgi:outer membrane protein OmpA-like peptidoglycan-associated protein